MNTQSKIVSRNQHRGATYSKVMDKRKRPIRGLWERNGRYIVPGLLSKIKSPASKVVGQFQNRIYSILPFDFKISIYWATLI
jgi:hypothetical protein